LTLARRRSSEAAALFMQRRGTLAPSDAQLAELRKGDPRGYAEARSRRLAQELEIAAEIRDSRVDYQVAMGYRDLGLHVRFALKDPKAALPFLEQAARGLDLMGQVALADTYQLALNDKAYALRAYRLALETASAPQGVRDFTPYAQLDSPMNRFWREWLAAEIAFLETGKPFAGRISEPAISGFWQAAGFWGGVVASAFPEWPQGPDAMAFRFPQSGGAITGVPTWQGIEASARALERPDLAAALQRTPATRIALILTLRPISLLADPKAILAELARNDPSGFWTTVALGTVAWHESGDPERRDLALRNGVAERMPGMARPGQPNALAQAARQQLKARALRAVEKKS
jgi:hypothetical protein